MKLIVFTFVDEFHPVLYVSVIKTALQCLTAVLKQFEKRASVAQRFYNRYNCGQQGNNFQAG